MATRQLSTKKIVNLSSNPDSASAGEIYYNTSSNSFKYYNGTSWVDLSSDGQNGSYYLDTSANAQTKSGNLTISGTATANILDLNESQLTADLKNITVTTPFLMDSFVAANYRSAEYILQFSQGTNYSMTKVMLIHNGTDVAISEYGHVEIGNNIPYDFSTAFSLGNLEVSLICSTANSQAINLKFTRTLFDT